MSPSAVQFGPYELAEPIGQGGMGIVFKAIRDGEVLAVKRMRPELADNEAFVRRFSRELRTAQAVRHRHLLEIVDGGEIDGELFVASPYLEGGSLAERLAAGAMDVADALSVLRQVAGALHCLHENGFVHRDVKPANIMFDAAGRAYLGDFGLARSEAFSVLTKPGEVMGTVAYIAPELLRGRPAGPESDIYALACTAYEALTGRRPYPDHDVVECIRAHLDAPPPDPCAARTGLPAAMTFVFSKGMAKDPAQRPRTPVAFATSVEVAARA